MERLVKFYKQLLEIRLAHKQLKDAGVPEKALGGVEDHADQHMSSAIGELVEDLITEFGDQIDKGRANELRIEIRLSLNALANRIDRGYHLEVRAGLPPEPEDEQEDDEEGPAISDEDRRVYEAVVSRQEALKFIKLEGSPILSLEEPTPDDDAAEESTASDPGG